jgi:putative endonuclease
MIQRRSMEKSFVYIMTTWDNTALYTGVTTNLEQRYHEHIQDKDPGSFTARYNCRKLVYFREFGSVRAAIREEKRIKGGSRKAKIAMIHRMNPDWRNLGDGLFGSG